MDDTQGVREFVIEVWPGNPEKNKKIMAEAAQDIDSVRARVALLQGQIRKMKKEGKANKVCLQKFFYRLFMKTPTCRSSFYVCHCSLTAKTPSKNCRKNG